MFPRWLRQEKPSYLLWANQGSITSSGTLVNSWPFSKCCLTRQHFGCGQNCCHSRPSCLNLLLQLLLFTLFFLNRETGNYTSALEYFHWQSCIYHLTLDASHIPLLICLLHPPPAVITTMFYNIGHSFVSHINIQLQWWLTNNKNAKHFLDLFLIKHLFFRYLSLSQS